MSEGSAGAGARRTPAASLPLLMTYSEPCPAQGAGRGAPPSPPQKCPAGPHCLVGPGAAHSGSSSSFLWERPLQFPRALESAFSAILKIGEAQVWQTVGLGNAGHPHAVIFLSPWECRLCLQSNGSRASNRLSHTGPGGRVRPGSPSSSPLPPLLISSLSPHLIDHS